MRKTVSASVRGSSVASIARVITIALVCTIFLLVSTLLILVIVLDRSNSKLLEIAFDSSIEINSCIVTDSLGKESHISLPYNIPFGNDGMYSLTFNIPKSININKTPSLCFYSNYIDLKVVYDDNILYSFPDSQPFFCGGTGNSYHFIGIPPDCVGNSINIDIACQLGNDIPYLICPVEICNEASFTCQNLFEGMPTILLAACMTTLAIVMMSLTPILNISIKNSSDIVFVGLFTLAFAAYILLELRCTVILFPHSSFIYTTIFILLALIPIPLGMSFLDVVLPKYRIVIRAALWLCFINLVVQCFLHFVGLKNLRVMMPYTHASIIVGVFVTAIVLIASGKKALLRLLEILPVFIGGTVDIFLLSVNKPSANNNFWFVLGVIVFLIFRAVIATTAHIRSYKDNVEIDVIRKMAYTDMLTGLANRNAYEKRLTELNETELLKNISCIVADINRLKFVNDNYGHSMGDALLKDVSFALKKLFPNNPDIFRTGGDEFIILLCDISEQDLKIMTNEISDEVEKLGKERGIEYSISCGSDAFCDDDKTIEGFISRVDTMMYVEKSKIKELNKIGCHV